MATLDKVFPTLIQNLVGSGAVVPSRDGDTRESLGVSFMINPIFGLLMNPRRKLNLSYAAAEVIWYLRAESSIEMIKHYAPQYARFAPSGHANGAYGPRLALHHVTGLLRSKRGTRQCVQPIFALNDLYEARMGDPDIPCTLNLHFLERDGLLHLFTTMRSNDVWLGLPYDVFAFTMLQNIVAVRAGLGLGNYFHSANSLHLYERNLAAAAEVQPFTGKPVNMIREDFNFFDLIDMEVQIRKNPHEFEDVLPDFKPYSIEATLISMILTKITPDLRRFDGYSFLGDLA